MAVACRRSDSYAQSDGESAGELICYADTNYNAAIGSNDNSGPNGPITIHGGKVTADAKTRGTDGAGIGGGNTGAGGTVTIYGGNVTATGGEDGAGIGGGDRCDGGEVVAHGSLRGAGIGSGYYRSSGDVTIAGGKVTAWCGTRL